MSRKVGRRRGFGRLTWQEVDILLDNKESDDGREMIAAWIDRCEKFYGRKGREYTAHDVILAHDTLTMGEMLDVFEISNPSVEHMMAMTELYMFRPCRVFDPTRIKGPHRRQTMDARNERMLAYREATNGLTTWSDIRPHYHALIADMGDLSAGARAIMQTVDSPGMYLAHVVDQYPGGAKALAAAIGYTPAAIHTALNSSNLSMRMAVRIVKATGCDAARLHPELA